MNTGLGAKLCVFASFAFLVAVSMLTRAPFFLDYPFPILWPDSGAYLYQAGKLLSGEAPEMLRVPAYALLVTAALGLSGPDYLAVVVVQTVLSLAAACYFLYAAVRLRWWIAPGLSAMLVLYTGGYMALEANFSVLSESLYTATLIFAAALALRYLESRRPAFLTLLSLAVSAAVLTRSAGAFLVGFYPLGALLLWLGGARRHASAFVVPGLLLLLPLLAYNWSTARVVALEPALHRSGAFLHLTAPFWRTDPSYGPQLNRLVESVVSLYAPEDLRVLKRSWDPAALHRVFAKRFEVAGAFGRHVEAYKEATAWQPGCSMDDLLARGELVAAITCHYRFDAQHAFLAKDAIRKSPLLYAKFVYANLFNWWFGEGRSEYDFYLGSTLQRHAAFYYDRPPWLTSGFTGFDAFARRQRRERHPKVTVARTPAGEVEVRFAPGVTYKLYRWLSDMREPIYRSATWPMLAVAVSLLAFAMAVLRRSAGATVLACFALLPLGASLVVSASSPVLPRYAYATEWMALALVALVPLLWLDTTFRAGASARTAQDERESAESPA